MTTAVQALRQLVEAAGEGNLDGFFAAHGVELMTAFGSTIVEAATANDLDLAVAIREEADLYSLIADLVEMLRFDRDDVVDLETADVVLAAEALGSVFRSSSPIPAYTLGARWRPSPNGWKPPTCADSTSSSSHRDPPSA